MLRMAVIVAGVLLSFAANAQSLRLKNFLHPESDGLRNAADIYLAGAIDALTAFNIAAPVKLFCKEAGIVSHQEAAHLIGEWAERQTKIDGDMLVVFPLLLVLKKTYPCH